MSRGRLSFAVMRGVLLALAILGTIRDGAAEPSAPGPVLTLVVRDAGGTPVSGASVVAAETEVGSVSGTGYFAKGATDAAGRADLSGLHAAHGRHRIRIAHPEFAECVLDDVHIPPEGRRLDIVLDTGDRLTGRVVDADGRPVSGATVVLRRAGRQVSARVHHSASRRLAVPHAPTSVTDAEGRFHLTRVAEGVHGLMATTAGGIGWRTGVRAGGAEAVVKLRVAHTLVFRSITSLMPGFPPGVDGENVPFRFDLPGAGEARIPGVAPGRYVARGLGSGQAVTIDVREDSPPEIEVALALPTPTPVRVLRLRVVDGVGKPVPNPIAVIVDERRPGCMTARTPHRGDDDGRLDMPDHYPSAIPFRVLAVARGRIGLGDWVVPTAEESVVRLTHATGRIRVRVEDAFTGDVIPGAEVRLIAFSSHLGAGTDRTGATGETRWFEGLAPAGLFPGPRRGLEGLGDGQQRHLPGSYAITVVAGDGYVPARRIVLVEGDRTVRFELDRVPVRSGVVVDRAGRPAAGIRVRLGRATADTGPDGRFMLRGRTSDPLAGPLHWTPFPGDRPGAGGTLLRPEGDLETHVIPDARRWPLEIRLAPADEGLAVRLNPGPGRVFMPAQAFVDQDGVARPGAFLAGAYRMLLLDGLGLVREKDLVLEPAPSDGHWILDLREVGRPR